MARQAIHLVGLLTGTWKEMFGELLSWNASCFGFTVLKVSSHSQFFRRQLCGFVVPGCGCGWRFVRRCSFAWFELDRIESMIDSTSLFICFATTHLCYVIQEMVASHTGASTTTHSYTGTHYSGTAASLSGCYSWSHLLSASSSW